MEQRIDGLELPSREDDNFDPGTRRGATGGSPPPSLASFAQLFGYQPLPLTCIYLCAQLASGAAYARHCSLFGVRMRDTGI